MANSITKSTVIESIWKNFFDRIKSQVTSVNISDKGVPESKTITIQTYASTFPDNEIDTKSKYPILVVDSPSVESDYFTLDKDKIFGSVTIDIYTNQAESADKFLSKIIDAIETYKHDFNGIGLIKIKLSDTTSDSVQRNQIKLHLRSAIFDFEYHYSKTRGY